MLVKGFVSITIIVRFKGIKCELTVPVKFLVGEQLRYGTGVNAMIGKCNWKL